MGPPSSWSRSTTDHRAAHASLLSTGAAWGYALWRVETSEPAVFAHDVLTCLFCDQPADDDRFRCELRVRPVWRQGVVELRYVCHIECLRKAAHPSHRVAG
jgi:hypothetical protein